VVADHALWAITNEKGEFLLKNVSGGEIRIIASCLGYARKTLDLKVTGDKRDLVLYMQEDNLALKEVVVTAQSKSDEITTSYLIDRKGLDHLQMLALPDVLSLLPGGQTNRNLHLATSTEQNIVLRASPTGEKGNPSFGTAIEVDGVRLSNNAAVGDGISGIDTRNIASSGIESVEVITGIPSVVYGDLTGGIVKINTRKGKSPLSVEASTKPNTKQVSMNKGFGLGKEAGVLNVNLEHTKSISDLASPYTSYDRNSLSLLYNNTFNKAAQPLTLTVGLTGNIGGYDSKGDPDAFVDTYTKAKDNTFRTHARLSYLLNLPWITNLEIGATLNSSNKQSEAKTNKSNSVSTTAIHGREEGYFVAGAFDENPDAAVVLIPPGYWYQTHITDSKPIEITADLKAKWVKKFGNSNNNILLGANFSRAGNRGKGSYYSDLRYAPTWREYRYDLLPRTNNLAVFLEDKTNLRINRSVLQLMAGVRSDMTFIKGSEYGTVRSFSPRFNTKYIFPEQKDRFVKNLSLRAGWGKALKLPSFAALYPAPSYRDILSFAPGTTSDGMAFYAWYIMPSKPQYNSELRWQHNSQLETGLEIKIKGATVNLSAHHTRTSDAYRSFSQYLPFSYKFTGNDALGEHFPIPSGNRQYVIDRTTGIVTVVDKTGLQPAQELPYKERRTFRTVHKYINDTPVTRKGLEWIVDFDEIKAIRTSVRLDGSWYNYRGLDETLEQYSPTAQNMADGNPYKYVGIYAGGSSSSNGSETRKLNTNLTFTTHIPVVRMIISLKIETSLYNYTQRLSEYQGKVRGFAIDRDNTYFPSANQPEEIYNSDRYIALYPLYYVSFDDMNTLIPFAEKFEWARDNDRTLYNELAKLVQSTNTGYYFNAARLSSYYSANISITKEIGDFASISFYALNFTNNMQRVKSSDTGLESSIYGSSYIPAFYYGLSLKLKIKN
jgi:hypothetical protein